MVLLLNHLGYETDAAKAFILQTESRVYKEKELSPAIIDSGNGERVFIPKLVSAGEVDRWRDRFFYRFDFSQFNAPGRFRIRLVCGDAVLESPPFEIRSDLLQDTCISDILFYLKSQRCSGIWDRADRNIPFVGGRRDRVDVHGGWYDAAGDYSKYLSHLSYADFFNPQQTPLVVWSLAVLYKGLECGPTCTHCLLAERALEEAMWGADFLVRMQDREGYFYTTVFDRWTKFPKERRICSYRTQNGELLESYRAGFRQGGGIAVAALAAISAIDPSHEPPGEYRSGDYLEAARRGYTHLKVHSLEYSENGRENCIDYYCSLLAAAELYAVTGEDEYIRDCQERVSQLNALFLREKGYLRIEEGSERPFFHASDEGLPITALARYTEIEKDESARRKALGLIQDLSTALLKVSDETYNPFRLLRRWVQAVEGPVRSSFFIPHENETGYWWQGENGALASVSCALRLAAKLFEKNDFEIENGLMPRMRDFATSQLDWILGLNPYDICMLQGRGRNNPEYEEFFPNAPGGICNGITAGYQDETDIDFLPEKAGREGDHRWRWSEQWIPHAAWFLLALSADIPGGEEPHDE